MPKCRHDHCIRDAKTGSEYCERCIQLPAKECNYCLIKDTSILPHYIPVEFIPPSGKVPSTRMRKFFFALLGGTAGFSSSVIFWLVYFFQTFGVPVSQFVRFESAFLITDFIIVAVLVVFYRRTILDAFRTAAARVEENGDEDGDGETK